MVKSECGFRLSRRLWGGMKNELSIPKNACVGNLVPRAFPLKNGKALGTRLLRGRLLRVRITLYPYMNKLYVTISTKQLEVNKRKQ